MYSKKVDVRNNKIKRGIKNFQKPLAINMKDKIFKTPIKLYPIESIINSKT